MNEFVRLIIIWLISTVAVYAAASFVPGISVNNFTTALIVALILGLLNAVIRPILVFFSFPLVALTLGLFLLVINAFMLKVAAYFISGFRIEGFLPAILGSIVISVVTWVLGLILGASKG
jgi:putative membrane protein